MALDALDVALLVARAFDVASIPYFLGGSLATSIHGEPRATNDIDFVADANSTQVKQLIDALGPDFSIDSDALKDAILRRATCNFFFLPLFTKVDLFVLRRTLFDLSEFARRRLTVVREDRSLFVKTPEDSVLRKLLWFVEGGKRSDRQWRDVVSVIRIGGPSLDDEYLDEWASKFDIAALLATARAEAAE
jgi:hypothetical protein